MKRHLRWWVLAAIVALVAAACTPEETAPDVAEEEPPPAEEGPPAEGEIASVRADSCDYGGKIESIEATDDYTVVFTMCKPVPAFEQIVAFTPFGIQPAGHLDATGGSPLDNPVGTGPFVLENWNRGDSVVFQRNDDYWGDPPAFQTLVFRWAEESAARLVDLQAGTVDYITNLATDDIPRVEEDGNLVLLPNRNPNTFYLGFANNHEPFGDVRVRQALAMGIDRQRIVDNFYPPESEVPTHFTPCSIENACEGDDWYGFDLDAAQALLAEAGAEGFDVTIYYRDVFRVYLPEPGQVALEIAQQLQDNLGINASVQQVESGEFIEASTQAEYAMYLLGWGADYPHVTNFLDFHFGRENPQFGDPHPEIYEPLLEAAAIADPAEAAPLYAEANNAIRELVPMVPIAHGVGFDAALASLDGAASPSFGAPQFELMDPGKDTLVFMQNAEPISIYCADETDGESLSACQQAVEPLFGYDLEGGVIPKLATDCEANEDGTVWTCTLRQGVTFHDGTPFDASHVIASWGAGIDAANPLHVGNTGTFDYYAYLWDGLINAPEEEEEEEG
jgi:peptide/nickel transport system substrate-binding protein